MTNADSQNPCFQIPDGATLLIVDDDPFVRRGLRRMLEVEGTAVVEAGDGEQAICVIERDEPELLDAVLTDLVMPVVSGSELISVLVECRPALPIVAMTAWAQLPRDFPPVPLLQKPFDHEDLIRTIAPLILRSRAVRRQAQQSRADAAESRTLAERQLAIAREQMARSGDLRKALMKMREGLTLH